MKYHWIITALLILMLLVLSACGSSESSSTQTQKTTLPTTTPITSALTTTAPTTTTTTAPATTEPTTTIPTTTTTAPATTEPTTISELFKLAMEKMNNVNSLRMRIISENPGSGESEISDNYARVRLLDLGDIKEAIIIYPDKYFTSDGITWTYAPGPLYEYWLGFIFTGLIHYIFPQSDVPIEYYEVTSLGNELIDGIETNHLRVMVDWKGIGNWLDANDRTSEVAYYMFEHEGNVYEAYNRNSGFIDVWIDREGFVHRIFCDSEEYMTTYAGNISADIYDFNEPIDIEPPDNYT